VLFLTAFGMGLAFCGPPGAVFAEALRRGLAGGFMAALTVEFGSLIGDAVWAVIGLSGAGLLLQQRQVGLVIGVAGVVLLAWLGAVALRDAWHGAIPAARSPSRRGDFSAGAALSLTNPQTVVYWIALGGTIRALIGNAPGIDDMTVFFAGFMLACLVYSFMAAGMIAGARRWLTRRLYRAVNAVCGVALLGFAIVLADATVR